MSITVTPSSATPAPIMSSQQTPTPTAPPPPKRVDYLTLLGDEKDLLESSYEEALSALDSLIEFYELDPDAPNTLSRYQEIVSRLKTRQQPLAEKAAMVFAKEKELHAAFKSYERELGGLNDISYEQMSKTAGMVFDENLRANEIHKLETAGLGSLRPIELDEGETLDLTLSKDELLKILDIEKRKRLLLKFKNDNLLAPEMRSLKTTYERLAASDKELKEFMFDRMEDMNKKVQLAKKTEGLDI